MAGHTFPILGQLVANDVKLIHMRHEQATAYAADAWARSTGTPGVCCVTAGCGLTNAITGLAVAALTNSAVVCLSGQHPTDEDGLDSFQELYGSEVCGSFAKYTRRILDWSTIEFHLRQAFRAAASPPQGVAVVEIPQNVLYHTGDESGQRAGARVYGADELRAQGDPRAVERAVQLLLGAERPLLVGGDGVFWSDAGAELRELAELTSTPGLLPAGRAGGGGRRPSAGRAGGVEEAVHQPGRCGHQLRIPLLERRALRSTADVGSRTPPTSRSTATRAASAPTWPPTCRSSATPSWYCAR